MLLAAANAQAQPIRTPDRNRAPALRPPRPGAPPAPGNVTPRQAQAQPGQTPRPGAIPVPGQNPAPAAQPGAAGAPDRDPPGAAGALPNTMDQIAKAADVPYKPKPPGHLVKFNLQDADLAELVNHISGMTGKRFIYGPKVRQIKATVVSPSPVTLAEAYEAFLSILEANGMTVIPHGRFLKIVDSGGVVGQATPIYARGEPVPDADRFITRLYRLKYVNAEEASTLLQKFKSKEGDISVYAPGQLLILTDTGNNVRRMIRIIEEIDVGGAGQRMWIEPVNYGSAEDMAKRINELFELDQQGAAGGAGSGGLSKVVADEQSNSLIVVGTEDSYLKLLELMKRLDEKPTEEGKVQVLPLQHASAEELANVLNQMIQGQAQRQPGQPGPPGLFEGDVRIIADKATNSLIVTSSGRDYASMRRVVDRLDLPRRQVFIEAVIMDVSVRHSTSLGVSFHGGTTADLGGGSDTLILGGFEAQDSLTFPANPELLQGVALGARGPELDGTQNLLPTGLSIPAFGIVLNALATSGDANVLATPHILATDNTPAEINVGENVPLQQNLGGGSSLGAIPGLGAQPGGAGVNPLSFLPSFGFNAPRQDVGIKIKVTPHINEANQVRLEIEQEISEAGSPAGALGAIPITKRTTNQTVWVDDQQTIVTGGLMRDAERRSRRKVPVLGDLPVLGFLFRHSEVTTEKLNLLLILTPHVIQNQEDLRKVFERKMQERQEFIDRYLVFSGRDWEPPRDWTRTNGLVEDIRQAHRTIDEKIRLEEESAPKAKREHTPSEPIELPAGVKAGSGGGAAAEPQPAPRPRPRPRPRTPRPQLNQPPATPPPAAPAQPPRTELDSPIRINPVARNVDVQRVE